ncbi:hypothetical protein Scep_000770 [Stephania cephalantha]|uniref:Pentatricopeptide repeat-containing protein n=1 Tax=Stephania cephalantha TaxID=152367 RepID=A0AAP0Q4F5_9MAGN
MPRRNTFSWNSIITGFSKSGFVDEAYCLFRTMPERDQCSWNSMISGFAQRERFEEAIECFVGMHREDFVLNEYSYPSALSACAGLVDLNLGTQIHASIAKSPFLFDVHMGSALIDMYSKCGSVLEAEMVFEGMNEKNIVTWNSLITCYEQNGPASKALELFVGMMDLGFKPDEVTLASVVSACATLVAIREGSQIHSFVIKNDKFRDDLVLSNALVDMYAKGRRIKEARRVFDAMPVRNVVTDTSMVSGYAKANGENEQALELFCLLKKDSIWPTHYTFGNVLNACANLANLELGKQAHAHVLKHGFQFESGPESDVFVGNSLVDMYTKCGAIEDGFRVFRNMVERDNVSWNAMIVGYAQNGYGTEALDLFRRMLVSGEKPDHVTMIGVLCACSHVGMVEEGRRYFNSMTVEHGLKPTKDHYTCMVDLLGRAGRLYEAKKLIDSMPMEPDNVIWGSLLGACRIHQHVEMGMHAAEKLMEIDPENSGPYVLLSNMYAEVGIWREVVKVRKMMRERGVVKQPGCSWIEINSKVHIFMAKDRNHPHRKRICDLLRTLRAQMKRVEYIVDVRCTAHNPMM